MPLRCCSRQRMDLDKRTSFIFMSFRDLHPSFRFRVLSEVAREIDIFLRAPRESEFGLRRWISALFCELLRGMTSLGCSSLAAGEFFPRHFFQTRDLALQSQMNVTRKDYVTFRIKFLSVFFREIRGGIKCGN